MNEKTTKRALFSSVLAIVLCLAMLIGTTFAWFTDTASTGVNKITSGNLKMKVSYKNDINATEFTPVSENTAVFDNNALWEPGHVEFVVLKVENVGTLALKYKLGINIAGETGSTNVLGNPFKLSDYINFAVIDGDATETTTDRATLVAAAEAAGSKLINEGYTSVETPLKAVADTADETLPTEKIVTLVVWMPTTVGNDANYAVGYEPPVINLGVNVVATQYNHEEDSFGPDYDKFAEYDNVTTVAIPAGDTDAVNTAFADALKDAVTSDVTTGATATQITLPANTTVTLNSGATSVPTGKTKDIKITGDKSTVVSLVNTAPGSEGTLSYLDGANLTFQGVTVNASAIEGLCARGGVVTFIDCKFNAELKKTIASKFVFSGCEFTQPVSQVGYGCKDVVFDDCTFNTDGYGIKIYSEGSTPVNLTVKNSHFNSTGSAAKSAIFLDHIIDGINYNITVDSCDFTGFAATPTPNYNRWATRVIVDSSFVQSGNQYVFSYQTGEEGGSYHKILTAEQLVVTVK